MSRRGYDATLITAQGRPGRPGGGEMSGNDADAELAMLRTEFPGHLIGEECIMGRIRYVARRRKEGANPHTVVTPDLGELRAALAAGQAVKARQVDG